MSDVPRLQLHSVSRGFQTGEARLDILTNTDFAVHPGELVRSSRHPVLGNRRCCTFAACWTVLTAARC